MKLYRGRMIDHLHLVVAHVDASYRFYAAVFAAIGIPETRHVRGDHFVFDELFVSGTQHPGTPVKTGRIHLAFATRERAAVDRFHAAAIAAGGLDNGAPGLRPYHPGYYAAFVLDPDGNNIEVVDHGPATYSAAAIEIDA
jgi:catechol 2,3-dioxygenase-like lactoylglutathione lyase family enzyme